MTAVALLARLAVFATQDGLAYDGTYYLRQAERLRHGHFDAAGFPPGFPIAAALAHLVVPDAVQAARLLNLVAGTLTVWLVTRLAARTLPRAFAIGTGLFLALVPDTLRTHTEVWSEPLHGALWAYAATAWVAGRDALAGASLGWAHLTRPETILGYGAWIGLRAVRSKRIPWALCGGLAAVAAYAFFASHAVGHPVLSPKQGQFEPGAAVAGRVWTTLWTLHAVFPLVLLPAALWWGVRHRREWLAPVLYIATLPLFGIHIQPRLHAPALPFLALLAAGWLAALPLPKRRIWLALAAAELVAGTAPAWKNLIVPQPLVPHARAIGAALAPYLQFDDRVAGRFPIAPYYAGAGFVAVPNTAPYDAFVDSLRARRATHLLVLESENQNILPQLRPLFENEPFAAAEARLQAIATVDAPPGARAILYALRPPPVTMANSEPASGETPPERARAAQVAQALAAHDEPQSAAPVGDWILYVSGGGEPALRALDPRTRRVLPVRFAGLARGAAVPLWVSTRGVDVAVTFRTEDSKTGAAQTVVATGTWPAVAGRDTVDIAGRWATGAALYDPRTAWVPDDDALFASIALPDLPEQAALCVLTPGGGMRRLSYGIHAPRAPQPTATGVEFLYGAGQGRRVALDAAQRALPEVPVFPAAP